jgi:hypothetical protein
MDDKFTETVEAMRLAQKEYFRDRSPQRLEVAKQLERLVDSEIKRRKDAKQPSLFGVEVPHA